MTAARVIRHEQPNYQHPEFPACPVGTLREEMTTG
jgi:hypothetical protein